MHRFFLPPQEWSRNPLALCGPEAKHCQQVLRLGEGDKIVVFDGQGREATTAIQRVSKDRVELAVITSQSSPPLPCRITLAQAIPKGKNMDLVIQKAVELGASRIVPLLSERTVVQLDPDSKERKREKWQNIAVEACKQCGQNFLPEVGVPATLVECLNGAEPSSLKLIASLQPGALHLKRILEDFHSTRGDLPSEVMVLVGPEGDFTPAEVSQALSLGCRPITLGPIILRTETAAIYCLSVLSHELLNRLSDRVASGRSL